MMDKERKELFNRYFHSIFGFSNTFSEKEYKESFHQFELNYSRFIPPAQETKILDVGCGTGHFLYYLEEKGINNYLGIDISPQQIDFCKENISPKVKLANAFEFLEDKENVYDVIVANDFLEHVPKQKIVKFLEMVNGALKKDALFLIKTPNMGNPFAIYPRYKDFTHEVGFTEMSLRQILLTAGFRDVQVLSWSRYHIPHSPRRFIEAGIARFIKFAITKLYQVQGLVAPTVLSPLLRGIAKK